MFAGEHRALSQASGWNDPMEQERQAEAHSVLPGVKQGRAEAGRQFEYEEQLDVSFREREDRPPPLFGEPSSHSVEEEEGFVGSTLPRVSPNQPTISSLRKDPAVIPGICCI